jgi:hypothetical protein
VASSDIERDLREKVSESVALREEGIGRFRVLSPFVLDDGDHLSIVLRREGERWVFADEGHTFMNLTYSMDEADLHKHASAQCLAIRAPVLLKCRWRSAECGSTSNKNRTVAGSPKCRISLASWSTGRPEWRPSPRHRLWLCG